nr:GntR family transcriptional regulator [Corynebacterium aquatimens]
MRRRTISATRSRQQHEEIAAYLHSLIESGKLSPGDPLPSEAELCEKFDSSRGPVRQAVASLRTEGLVSSGRGRRSIVLDHRGTSSFDSLLSATTLIEDTKKTPGQKILRIVREPADEQIAAALHLSPGDDVVKIERVRYADDLPVMVQTNVFPIAIGERFLTLTEDSESVHAQLARSGVKIDNVVRRVRVRMTTEEEQQLLQLEESAPVWSEELRASTFQGEPVEYAECAIPGNMADLIMSNVRGSSIPLKFELVLP